MSSPDDRSNSGAGPRRTICSSRSLDRGPPAFIALIALEALGRLQAERGDFDLPSTRSTPLRTGQACPQLGLDGTNRGRSRDRRTVGGARPLVAPGSSPTVLSGSPARACAQHSPALRAWRPSGRRRRISGARGCRAATHQEAIADGLIARLIATCAATGRVPPRVVAVRADCAAERSRIGGDGDPDLWREAAARWDECGNPCLAAYANWRQAERFSAPG